MKITLFVDKRHVKDILRSMAHELVHHAQNCRGEFKNGFKTGEGYAQEDGHMREMEREAYEEGQMMLRDFEDKRKKKEKAQMLEEEVAYILKRRKGVSEAACRALNNPKNIKRRKLLPDRGVAEIGGSLKQSVNVKSFEHAYQMAQCHGADTFRYRGYKGKKFVNDEFKTDLYEIDPTRGLPDEHFDQMQKAYDRARRNLEESTYTLKENKTMAELENPKKADLDKDGELSSYEKKRGAAIEKSMSGEEDEQNEAHCPGKRDENEELKETDDKATVQRQLEKWQKKCAKPGANRNMCKQKIDLLKARLKKLNEDSSDNTLEEKAGEKKTKWVIDGDTVLCDEGCTEEEAKARIKKRADAREKGKSRRKGDEMNEGWTKKKDQLLFERLVKKWAK